MTSRTTRLSVVGLFVLALSACTPATGANRAPSAAEGTIDLAVSETCTESSDPKCISVNGEHILLPSSFDHAGVEDAAVTEGGQNAVDVTFSKNGTEILSALTKEAAGAGEGARLVIQIGGETKAAVVVMEALESSHLRIVLPPGDSAEEVAALIRGQ